MAALPVVVTTRAVALERVGMAVAVIAAWSRLCEGTGAPLHILDAGAAEGLWETLLDNCGEVHRLPPEGSQRERHVQAQHLTRRYEWAIWTDDDVLPNPNPLWLDVALQNLDMPRPGQPPWGLVSVHLPQCHKHAEPDYRSPRPVASTGSVGGMRFVRPDAIAEFPPLRDDRPGYDSIMCNAVRANGLDVGHFTDRRVRALHMGEWMSTVWPDTKAPEQPECR